MDTRPIGVLDSGVGGLTVWKEIVTLLPQESTIYIGDSKNTPYGIRTKNEIIMLASRMIEFLLRKDVKMIVIACNTITVSGIEKLREHFSQVPIIGTVPVIKTAVRMTKKGTIGVLSTTRTAQSEYQKSLIDSYAQSLKVVNIGTNRLVPLIEKGETAGKEILSILEEELAPFTKEGVDVLALGCTHFPFMQESMQKILGESVTLLHSGEAIARQVENVLVHNRQQSCAEKAFHTLYTTGNIDNFKKVLSFVSLTVDDIQSISL